MATSCVQSGPKSVVRGNQMNIRYNLFFWGAILSSVVMAKEPEIVDHNRLMDHGDGHLMDMDGGMVMGQNKDKLPAEIGRASCRERV